MTEEKVLGFMGMFYGFVFIVAGVVFLCLKIVGHSLNLTFLLLSLVLIEVGRTTLRIAYKHFRSN